MSKLSDKMKELSRELSIFSISELYDLLLEFDEDTLSDLFINDMLVYLNDKKTQCLTVTLLDKGVSIQYIWEDPIVGNPTFLAKNLDYKETLSLLKTILRKDKIKKLQHG